MPASAHNPKTKRCVEKVMAKGHDKVSAIRICQTSTGESYLKKRIENKSEPAPWSSIAVNFQTRKVRTETLNGKEYFVAPMTLIVPGVLNGSQGALYYPADEIAKNYQAWDNIPITVYHPTHNGRPNGTPVIAKAKGVLNRQGIGFLKSPHIRNSRLRVEGWFDKEKTKQVDSRVYEALSKNQSMEVSTGLFTENIPAQNGAKCPKGRAYTHIARNYKPDHLAVLPDQNGACSRTDGCGLNVNSFPNEESVMKFNRAKTVKFLTTNCDCWKGKEELLSNEELMSDEDLKKLKANADKAKQNELIVNSAVKGFKDGDNEYKFDLEEGSWVGQTVEPVDNECSEDMEDDEEEMPMMKKKKKGKPAMNEENGEAVRTPKPKTAKDWLKEAPEAVRNTLAYAQKVEMRERDRMIEKLTENIADEERRDARIKKLQTNTTAQLEEKLEELMELAPKLEEEEAPVARGSFPFRGDYSGAAVAPIGNRYDEKAAQADILELPTLNWAEVRDEHRGLKKA